MVLLGGGVDEARAMSIVWAVEYDHLPAAITAVLGGKG